MQMKLEEVVKNVADKLVSNHFVSMNDCGLICRYPFRTHDIVACNDVQDLLDAYLKTREKPDVIVNILDFYHHRESFEWQCCNVMLCCLPLATCTTFDALSTWISGPYYEIEIWKNLQSLDRKPNINNLLQTNTNNINNINTTP